MKYEVNERKIMEGTIEMAKEIVNEVKEGLERGYQKLKSYDTKFWISVNLNEFHKNGLNYINQKLKEKHWDYMEAKGIGAGPYLKDILELKEEWNTKIRNLEKELEVEVLIK